MRDWQLTTLQQHQMTLLPSSTTVGAIPVTEWQWGHLRSKSKLVKDQKKVLGSYSLSENNERDRHTNP